MYCIIIYLSFLNCDWLLVWEVYWLYWKQELLVPVEKFTVRMPMVRFELATPGLQTQWCSHWAIELNLLLLERSWVYPVGVLHHYIFLSFLNCDWLLVREVQWLYWTQELLVPGEEFTVRMPIVRLELEMPWITSLVLYSSMCYCWEGSEFIQLVYCIIIYFYYFSNVIDFSSDKYSGSTRHRNSW